MSLNKTTYLADALLKHVLKAGAGTAFAQPTTVYLSLHTADPTKTGSHANEVSTVGTAYARQAITFGALSTSGAGDTSLEQASNNAGINFAQATAAWGTVTHVGIEDAVTAGNMLYFGPLTASSIVANTDTFTVPTSNLTVQEG